MYCNWRGGDGQGVEDCLGERGVGVCLKNSVSQWEVGDWEPVNLGTNSGHTTEWPTHGLDPHLPF